jgi:hypothetical protein
MANKEDSAAVNDLHTQSHCGLKIVTTVLVVEVFRISTVEPKFGTCSHSLFSESQRAECLRASIP